MLEELQNFYLDKKEPLKSCFLALRDIITSFDDNISEHWKYKLPFFYFKGKPFCYLWYNKKTNEPYIGVAKGLQINSPFLELGNRTHIKIMRINPCADIPIESVYEILREASKLY
jgi:hypothetical protein